MFSYLKLRPSYITAFVLYKRYFNIKEKEEFFNFNIFLRELYLLNYKYN
jgi:hypothetical protein